MPRWPLTCLAVAVGGGLGAVARETLLGVLANALGPSVAPWILLLPINLSGCLAIGFVLMTLELRYHRVGRSLLRGLPHAASLHAQPGLFAPDPTVPATEYASFSRRGSVFAGFWVTGLIGGFTTFSAFSLDLVEALHHGHVASALLDIALSVGLGVAAVMAGMALGR